MKIKWIFYSIVMYVFLHSKPTYIRIGDCPGLAILENIFIDLILNSN